MRMLWFYVFRMKIFLFAFICFWSAVHGSLEERLKRFDVFHHGTVRYRINKRDIYSRSPEFRGLEVESFGRKFKFNLKRHRSLFSENFRVVSVDEGGRETAVDIDPNLYHGTLEDDEHSLVNIYFNEGGSFTGTVVTRGKKYVFEPSWRHLPNQKNVTMIVYEEEDVNFEKDLGTKFCEAAHLDDGVNKSRRGSYHAEPNGKDDNHLNHEPHRRRHHSKGHEVDDDDDDDDDDDEVKGHKRSKRSPCSQDNKMICTVALVADYKFFVNMGNSDYQTTTGYLISVIDNINNIYTKQDFGVCGTGFGFEIREIKIHKSYSNGVDPLLDFNLDKTYTTNELLEQFSRDPKHQNFCLAHLFTYTSFQTGVLGLAWIAQSKLSYLGGICSPSHWRDGREFYSNTGWSTSVNKYNRKLLTVEAYLVTAHELGHNWGSEHDPDMTECSPSQGKFIMYMYSVSGREENNKNFSPCSKRSISAVLRGKAQSCFSQRSGTFCGNFKVEEGEECDEGPKEQKCCQDCKLKEFSKCSDLNHQCCESCQFASSSKPCHGGQDLGCKEVSKCSGFDTSCNPAGNKPNGTTCSVNGKCINGKCLSICEFNNKLPCICPNASDSCKWCCKTSKDAVCLPHDDLMDLPEGTPCFQGFCNKGVCKKEEAHNSILRLWKVIENIDANKLVMFMKANIVGTVIILSLVIWIPASCIVACVDRKRAKKQKEEYRWYQPDNDELLPPWEDKSKVRPIDDVKVFPGPG